MTSPSPSGTQVIAHRGASRAERENTLAAFRRAAAMGADAVELDVRPTSDGVLVVHHDAHLADGRSIPDLVAAELPEHVPSLGAALDACAGMWVNVEIKHAPSEPGFHPERRLADEVVDHLRERGDRPDRWVISSFDRRTVDRVRERWDELPTAWLTLDASADQIRDLAAAGHRALHPEVSFVTPAMLAACREAGLALNTWTCDDPHRMAELVAWGVDGICTNVPDVALEVLGRGRPGGSAS